MEGITIKMAAGATGEAIVPYLPLFKVATDLISKIIDIYETAEYNKNICETLVNRVKLTENAIDTLKRRKQKNDDRLRNDGYYKAFNRFIYVLREIKEFAADITNIHGFRKYTKAYFVKENFQKLTNDYDVAMKDLHFTIAVANEEQRKIDEEALREDLAEMSKYLEKMHDDILENKNKVNILYDMVRHMKKHLLDDDKPIYGANKIDSKDLTSPARGRIDDKRGKKPNLIVRKIYKGQEVACKFTEEAIEESSKIQRHLEILVKLSECKHILRFYGISKIEINNVMVFEWAERGTLRQLYLKKHILWHYKVRIALEICRGLIFLQEADILHHDLKCENILMAESLEPKIYNFELARFFDGKTTPMSLATEDIISWLAPEKLDGSRYTTQCEIFSFGMLLWELAFEKIPYQGWEVDKIGKHVTKGGRERIIFGASPKTYQEEYKKIINDIWKQNPHERISFMKLLDLLEELYNSVRYMFDDNSSGVLPDKLDLDGSKEISDADLELSDENIRHIGIKPVISLEEGIRAFKNEEHQKAWECFDFHAKNNNTTAKYWKGRCLWDGLLNDIKGREEEGRELLKEAADEGNHDAQLRYAFTLSNIIGEDDNRQTFLEYLKKAANEGNNSTAQFNLGDIYYKGKCGVSNDENEGIKWLIKAALQDNSKATKFLNKLGINVYDINKYS